MVVVVGHTGSVKAGVVKPEQAGKYPRYLSPQIVIMSMQTVPVQFDDVDKVVEERPQLLRGPVV